MQKLTTNQRAIWFDQLVHHRSSLYNLGGYVRIEGEINFDLLEKAIHLSLKQTDVFNFSIVNLNGEPHLKSAEVRHTVERLDWRNDDGSEATIKEQLEEKHQRPLDWNNGELHKFSLIQLKDDQVYWHIKVHHVLIDGWGVSVLIKNTAKLYEQLIRQEEPTLSVPNFQDAILADEAYEQSLQFQQDKQFWLNQFSETPSPLNFPEITPGFAKREGSFRESFLLSWSEYHALNQIAKEHKISSFHLFLASVYVYCAKAYQSYDFCIGTPILNRSNKQFKNTVGLFTGISPLRVQTEKYETVAAIGANIRHQLRQNFRHQRFPLSNLLQELRLGGDKKGLFDVMLSFEKHDYQIQFGSATTQQEALHHGAEKTPLAIYVREYGQGEDVKIDLDFRGDIWDSFHAQQFKNQWKELLLNLDEQINRPLNEVNLLSHEERELQLKTWNSENEAFPNSNIVDQFRESVNRFGKNVAVADGENQLTYSQLDERSNQLAHLLIENGIQSGSVVGIRTDRQVQTFVAILAIVKTGAAYLPIDSNYPIERQRYMATDAKVAVLINTKKEAESLGIPYIDLEFDKYLNLSKSPLKMPIQPHDVAYIIYTSGSTGNPKGVMVTHGGTVNQSMAQSASFGVVPEDRCMLYSSLSFDSSVAEIFMTWFRGASLIICPDETRKTPSKFEAFLNEEKITFLTVTPSYLSLLRPEAFANVRALLTGGEAVKRKDIRRIAQYCEHYNVYGPTENSVCSSFYHFDPEVPTGINMPIGKPVVNTQVYVLDDSLKPMPIGSVGELYLGGAQLAKGYINKPEETDSRFIPSPFNKSEKLYRTGDLGKYLPDGNIVYLGRTDDQIKLRGFRIEIGEIENALVEHPEISNAGVLLKKDHNQEGFLVAFYLSEVELQKEDLREHLLAQLPEFMVPARFVPLKEIPLSVNGKVNRKALAKIKLEVPSETEEYVATESTWEQWIEKAWKHILGLEKVSKTANFFHLGGHSLKAAQFLTLLEKEKQIRVPLSVIFERPILHELAKAIEAESSGQTFTIPVAESPVETFPVTPSQKNIWLAEEINEDKPAFNIPVAVVIKGALDTVKLQASIDALLEKHAALRTTFTSIDHEIVQRVHSKARVDLQVHVGDDLQNLVRDYVYHRFDLTHGPLLKIGVFDLSDENHLFLLSIHHLIADGWSINLLLQDLEKIYHDSAGEPVEASFSDYVNWTTLASKEKLQAGAKIFWEQQFASLKTLSLPYDFAPSKTRSYEGEVKQLKLSKEQTNQLHQLCQNRGLSPFMVLQAITKLVLHKLTKATDFAIGSPVSGREASNVQNTVGLFVQTLPFRTAIDPEMEVSEYLQQIKKSTLLSIEHQNFPVDAMAKASGPAFNVLVSMDNQNIDKSSKWLNHDHQIIKYLQLDYAVSKFDLSFSFMDQEDGLNLNLLFNTQLFSRKTANLLIRYWENMMEQIIDGSSRKIVDLNLCQGNEKESLDYLGLDPEEIERAFPLTAVQRDMYLTSELAPSEAALRTLGYLFVRNKLNVDYWKQALEQLTEQESILRTTTLEKNGVAYQAVRKSHAIHFEYLDFSDRNVEESEVKALVVKHCELTQDVHQELVNHWLIKLSDECFVSVLSAHHMLMDGSSFSYFYELLDGFYTAIEQNKPHQRNPYTSPFFDFAHDIDFRFDRPEMIHFWSEHLKGVEPLDYRGVLVKNSNHITDHIDMGEELSNRVKKYCKENRIRPDLYFKGLVALLVRGVCAIGADFCLRENLFGRSKSNLNTLGCFMSTKPLRIYQSECNEQAHFPDFCKAIKKEGIRTKDAGNISVSAQNKIIGNEPLSFYFNFQKFLEPNAELNMSYLYQVFHVMKEQVEIRVGENNTGFDFRLDYDESVFNGRDFMQRLIYLSEQLVNGAATIGELKWALPEEQKNIRHWSVNPHHFEFSSVLEQYQQRSLTMPLQMALTYENEVWTYQDLEDWSNQLANYLKSNGGEKGDRIALICQRGPWMIAGVLASMKIGACYIPIDADLPEARIQYILKDSAAKMVLSDVVHWNSNASIHTFQDCVKEPKMFESVQLIPTDSAYIIYTSGTTGKPKGVEVPHSALSNISQAWMKEYQLDEQQPKMLQLASFSFDVCTGDIVRSLCNGGSLVIGSKEVRLDPESLVGLINLYKINMFEGTPGLVFPLMKFVAENDLELPHLNTLVIGSDTLSTHQYTWLKKTFGDTIRIINSYGVTEACIDSAYFDEVIEENLLCATTPIGNPLHNTEFAVLDGRKQLVPIGIPGELFIAGPGLAKGYVNQPQLTRQKFVDIDGQRFYATGDQVRWLSNGKLEFLERTDQQVKIRGYRIELAEIENQLLQINEIKNAVVAAPKVNGERVLAAYIIASSEIQVEAIKSSLIQVLPEYMVPQHFISIDSIPLTNNGKIDFNALPSVDESLRTSNFVAPRNELEIALVDIWQRVLQRTEIGIEDNFFEIGGHSLKATQLVSEINKQLDVVLPLNLVFKHPRIAAIAEHWPSELSKKSSFLAAPVREFYPLSSAQMRTYLLQAMDPNSTAYNMSAAFELTGDLEVSKFKQAFQKLVDAHEVLRTSFHLENGTTVQKIHNNIEVEVACSNDYQASYKDLLGAFVRPFDLSKAPLLRIQINSSSSTNHLLMLDMHHIIADGVTVQILVKDLMRFYAGAKVEKYIHEYKDFVWHQQNELAENIAIQKEYWLSQQIEEVPNLDFPTNKRRPSILSGKGKRYAHSWPEPLKNYLTSFSKQQGFTVQQILQTAFVVLLQRYTNKSELVIGNPVSGRTLAETQNMAGMFVNTLAVKHEVSQTDTFTSLLKRSAKRQMEALENQDYPFEQLVEALNVKHDRSRHPLFDIAFSYLKPEVQQLTLVGLTVEQLPLKSETSKFDLLTEVVELDDRIQLEFEYSTDLFEDHFIQQIATDYLSIVEALLTHPEQRVSKIDFLEPHLKQSLIDVSDESRVGYPQEKLIHELFGEQVVKHSEKTALTYKGETWTYSELNQRANLIASHLPRGGQKIALLYDRGLEMIAAILAVLKSGNCYVPIDPNYPQDRIQYTLKDSNANCLLTERNPAQIFTERTIVTTDLVKTGDNPCDYFISPKSDAYVIYTSGSTGKPKGVPITHQNVVRLFVNDSALFDFDSNDVWTLFHSYCFDFSVWEIYGALLFGGKLVVVDAETVKDPTSYVDLVENQEVSILNQTPGAFYNFSEIAIQKNARLESLKQVIFGGEALQVTQLENWRRTYPKIQLINMYGITETTVHVTYKEITEQEITAGWSNIGRPIPTLGLLILDEELQLVPKGVVGELCVYGAGLSYGYLNRDELSAQKFVDHPFDEGKKLYRSGDLARMRENGEVEYIGRADNQVKIRGYRIETGEVANVMLEHPQVEKSAVLAHKDVQDVNYLAAYYVGSVGEDQLKRQLEQILPAHMVPSWIIRLEKLPLTVNGKLNRKALPVPHKDQLQSHTLLQPETPTEQVLHGIWSEIIGNKSIGVDQGFFEVGGHSLAAAKVVGRIHQTLKKELELSKLFSNPSIRSLAAELEGDSEQAQQRILPIEKADFYPCSSAEQRLFVIHQMNPNQTTYNIPGVFEIQGELNKPQLQQAFEQLVERHEILRTNYSMKNDQVVRLVHPSLEVNILENEYENKEIKKVSSSFVRPFDLEKDTLFRIEIATIDQKPYLLFDIHHIICDGVSMETLISELQALVQKQALLPNTITYKDYAAWQKQWVSSADYQKDKSFWIQQFEEEVPVLYLPTDFVRPAIKSHEGARHHFQISPALGLQVRHLAQQFDASPFAVFLTSFKLLLAKYSGQTDLVVGTPVSGRTNPELEPIMGMMVNTLALRTNLNWDESFSQALSSIRQKSFEALTHQNYPFEDLLDTLALQRDMSRNPLFDIMFSYQHESEDEIQFSSSNFRAVEFEHPISKMDITLDIFGKKDGSFTLSIEYATRLFRDETMRRMAAHLEYVLGQIVQSPQKKLFEFELPTETEKNELIYGFNNTLMDFRRNLCIGGLFEECAKNSPDDLAVQDNNCSWTYGELEKYSGRVAVQLADFGLKPNARIAMMMERSVELVATQIAVLRAGMTYVYLDPDLPSDRIDYILNDCQAGLLITNQSIQNSTCPQRRFDQMNVSTERKVRSKSSLQDLAYIIYTSGTTGIPKGVAVEQNSVLNLAHWFSNAYNLAHHKNILQMTNMSFDVAVEETLVPLMYGACIHIASREVVLDQKAFYDFVENRGIDIAQFVPSTLEKLVVENDFMPSLKILICGGERLNTELKQSVMNMGYELYNHYGPTETTVDSLVWKCSGHNARLVHRRVRARAQKTPDRIAVASKHGEMSYATLYQKAERLAAYLQHRGVKKGDVIAISLERSLELVVGILGILKAGAAYLPIDANSPKDRLTYMLEDSGAKFVLTKPGIHEANIPAEVRMNINDVSLYQHELLLQPPGITTEDLAYVIYTSGSTGNPKGVQIEHASLNNFLQTTMAQYANGFSEEDVCLSLTNISFDVSVCEIFIALVHGAKLFMLDREDVYDIDLLTETMLKENISFAYIPPSLLQDVHDKLLPHKGFLSFNKLMVGVEPIRDHVLQAFKELHPKMLVMNSYGPTESTIYCTSLDVPSAEPQGGIVPIGRPIFNTQIYILNEFDQLQPIGVPGELCISGEGLARGYLNRPELTAEKFTQNPITKNERMYRTGDIARWLPNGTIEFVGRKDFQLKIRGFRIEPGEIENQMLKLETVKQVLVIALEDNDEKYLCAYYTAKEEIPVKQFKDHLSKSLPEYMIPEHFMFLDHFPLTKNEKVDRKQLPTPERKRSAGTGEYRAPKNETEQVIQQWWMETLDMEQIGVDVNFFELGGNSLKIIGLFGKMKERYPGVIAVNDLFDKPTIQQQASHIDQQNQEVTKEEAEEKEETTKSIRPRRVEF